jgi:hypothetical protein
MIDERFQMKNVHFYSLEQGQSYVSDKQSSLEDRYYNNQAFQVCFINLFLLINT